MCVNLEEGEVPDLINEAREGLQKSPGEAELSQPGKGTYSVTSRGKGQGGLAVVKYTPGLV